MALCLKHASCTAKFEAARLMTEQWQTGEYKIGIYLLMGDSSPKGGVIPHKFVRRKPQGVER